jgi:hypothetical protein
MNYERIYNEIITRAQQRESIIGQYYERHHIVPRCISGDDSNDNLVSVTLREHFLCHLLLTRMYTGDSGSKMKQAVMRMIPNVERACSKNRCYDKYRSTFYINRSLGNKIKTNYNSMQSKQMYYINRKYRLVCCTLCKLINYTKRDVFECSYCSGKKDTITLAHLAEITNNPLCMCGCGNHTAKKHNIWIKNHITICSCGCKELKKVTQNLTSCKLYLHGHNGTGPSSVKKSNTIKNQLAKLTKEQMAERLKNSLQSCDHEQRAKSISNGKCSIIKVIFPDDRVEYMQSNETYEKIGIRWPTIKHILMNAGGYQRTTGYRYEWITRYQLTTKH